MCVTFLLPLGIKELIFVFAITGTGVLATAMRNNCTPYSTLLFHPIFVNSPDLLYRQAIQFFGITMLLMLKKKSYLSSYLKTRQSHQFET